MSSELQRVQAQLGDAPPAAPSSQPEEEETLCVVCMDAPKNHINMVPCMHVCACEECARQLLERGAQNCPVCRAPVERSARVFFSSR